jgi:hypothetical protein
MPSIISYDIDGRAYVPAYLGLMKEIESISDHSSVDTAFSPTRDAGTFFSQGQPLIDEGLINSRPFDIPRYTYNPDVDAEVGSQARAGARLGGQLTRISTADTPPSTTQSQGRLSSRPSFVLCRANHDRLGMRDLYLSKNSDLT